MTTPLDSLDFFGAARRVPEQAEAALLAAQDAALPEAEHASQLVIAGAGAAAWSAAVVASVAAQSASRPTVVVDDGELPRFVGAGTLVLALSLHGREREAIDAASAAAAAGATVIVVAGGGELVARAGEWRAPVVPVDRAIPHARAALGALVVAPLVVLDRLGIVPGTDRAVDQTIAQLHRRRDELAAEGNDAERLARRIGRTIPVVYGAGAVGRLAARRWKQQCNTNAKIPAFAHALPELAHDELAGWGQHGDVTRQVLTAVLLRHDHEGHLAARLATLDGVLEESVAAVHSVQAKGECALALLMDLAYVGDVVSLHLAAQAGLDPGPAPALETGP